MPRLTLTFTSVEREGGDITFHGQEGEYLFDDGGYMLYSKDFTVLVPNGKTAEAVERFAEQYDEYVSDDDKGLVTLTADESEQDFVVTVADVPPEDDDERYEDGMAGYYLEYETPKKLWGHEVQLPPDYVPDRLCYVGDEQWHDIELFEKSDLPCG